VDRIAVFVDAGYLLTQGSAALCGAKQPRATIILDEKLLLSELETFALACEPNCSFLRIYWYDGLIGFRETAEQRRLGDSAFVKLRLGTVNAHGDQKGVDSLIVTDIVDLARCGAIVSAVVVAGDEDVRIGVEIAQRYGVRVHLLGMAPSRGSQSLQLLREADTTAEWDAAKIRTFLSVQRATPSAQASPSPSAAGGRSPSLDTATEAALRQAASILAGSIAGTSIAAIVAGWDAKTGVDRSIDGRLLAQARNSLCRDLNADEKLSMRRIFIDHLRTLLPT
jgi:NYN domain